MAVPERINEDEQNEEENALFEEHIFDDFSDTPPHLLNLATASQRGLLDDLRIALDNLEGSIDQAVEDGDTALHLACLYGHFPCVQLLVERGANVEAKDEDGALPLHDACAGGYIDIVRFLISIAGDSESLKRMLESVDAEGDTPLHHAARGEHVDIIRLLLDSGSSLTTANLYGKIPSDLPESNTEAKRFLDAAVSEAQRQ